MQILKALTSGLLFAGVGSACASSTGALVPAQCNKTDRHGTYLVTFTTESGNCGDVPKSLVNVDSPPVCQILTSTWSENDCKLETTQDCNGAKSTGVTTQKSPDGSYLEGTLSLQTSSCIGTYGLAYSRQ